jgi:hypothetical protein
LGLTTHDFSALQLNDGVKIPQLGLGGASSSETTSRPSRPSADRWRLTPPVYEMDDKETVQSVTWALEAGVRHVDSATCAFRASSRWRALAAASFQRFAAGPILTYPVFGCRRVRERGCLQEGDRGFLREERRPPVGGLLHDQAARADDVRQGGRGDPVLGRARPGRLRRPLPDALGHRRAPAPRGELARVRVGQEGEARPEHRRLQLCVPRQRLSPRHQARLTALLARSARGCQAHRGARRARRRRVEARDRLAPVDQSGTPASCQEPTVRATERATTDARARFGSPSD